MTNISDSGIEAHGWFFNPARLDPDPPLDYRLPDEEYELCSNCGIPRVVNDTFSRLFEMRGIPGRVCEMCVGKIRQPLRNLIGELLDSVYRYDSETGDCNCGICRNDVLYGEDPRCLFTRLEWWIRATEGNDGSFSVQTDEAR